MTGMPNIVQRWCMCAYSLILNSVQDLDPPNQDLSQPMSPASETSSKSASPEPTEPPPKRKRKGGNNEADDALLLLSRSALERRSVRDKKKPEKQVTPRNTETNYGLEIAETLNRFTLRQRALAKFRIQQVLLEVEFPDEIHSGAMPPPPNMSFREHNS